MGCVRILLIYGACSSMVERLTVDEEVVGSTPIRHPKHEKPLEGFFNTDKTAIIL